ncbi:unnamed protein product, partial [Rotaria sordida]
NKFKENHAIIDLFENSGTLFLRQDTGLYRLQVTNECSRAISCLHILVQTVPSSQDTSLHVSGSSKDFNRQIWTQTEYVPTCFRIISKNYY